jgi:AraC-like DNA-binding protein
MIKLFEVNTSFILFSSGLCLLTAYAEWFKRDFKTPSFLAVICIVLSTIQLRTAWFLDQSILENPWYSAFLSGSVFVLGPFVLATALGMISFAFEKKINFKAHMFPVLIILITELGYYILKSDGWSLHLLYKPGLNSIEKGFLLSALVHISAYLLYIAYLNKKLEKEYEIKYSKMVRLILSTPLLGVLLIFIGMYIGSISFTHSGSFLIALTCCFFLVYGHKYPDFFESLKGEIEIKKYERTSLSGLDVASLKDNLKTLMEVDKMYQNENLRLADIADELAIHPHQCSRVLNESFGQSFHDFINSFRIEEAKRLLKDNPEMSVLDIAFYVGFGSKSSFHKYFLKLTGLTPVSFRES